MSYLLNFKTVFIVRAGMYYVAENHSVCNDLQSRNLSWSKYRIYNNNNDYVLMATKKYCFPKSGSKSLNLLNIFVFYVHQDFVICLCSTAWIFNGSQKIFRSSSTDSSKPLFTSSCFMYGKSCIQQNKKDIVAIKILTLFAELH